ncbi:hypothetical protein B0H16DRAFT_1745870 [Mycena metata]|uniref:Uncharacterized protein n=1 Tax=Mycena metata TaxID=1033252 RepID=A0AAD7H0A1_9AGAR|nr:hypothetical protein B0H16DRAFT_1745870 [Mycena metata]
MSTPTAEAQAAADVPSDWEEDNVDVPTAEARAYAVSSTTVLYNLPEEAKQTLLRGYRFRHLQDSLREARAHPNPLADRPAVLTSYDMCCQYFKNLHALRQGINQEPGSVSSVEEDENNDEDGDEDDDGLPPLEPISRSSSEGPIHSEPAESEAADHESEDDDSANESQVPAQDQFLDAPPQTQVCDEEEFLEALPSTQVPRPAAMLTNGEAIETMRYHLDGEPVERGPTSIKCGTPGEKWAPDPDDYMIGDAECSGDEAPVANTSNAAPAQSLEVEAPRGGDSGRMAPRGAGHILRIIGTSGVREVLCHCSNGKHRGYERRRVYCFKDEMGNIVIKKAKALLLPSRTVRALDAAT